MALVTRSNWTEPIVSRHHPLGASTGYMDDLRGDWAAQVRVASGISPFAVELSALSEPELPSLSSFLREGPNLPFRYISLHGPSKSLTGDEAALVEALVGLLGHVDAVVMHPDTIGDPALFRPLGSRLLIENMDSRKETGRNVAELEAIFSELPAAGFCFDVAHAWSIDPEMSVAAELLDAFGSRLRHVHLSSLSEDLHHVPLDEEDEELFAPILSRCLDVPWILEAPPRPIIG
jgi:hypothetical protein